MKKISSLLLLILLFNLSIYAQEIDPVETGKALFKDAYKRAYNIEAGGEIQSLLVLDRRTGFSDYLKVIPNVYSYYISFPTVSKFEHSDTYMAMDWKIGKRVYMSNPTIADSVSIFNCEKMAYYFLGTSIQFEQKKPLGKHAYWAWKPGMYFDFIIGDLKPEITNGSQTADIVIVSYAPEPQTLRPLDIGLAVNVEFGIHAAYIGFSFREGLRNLAPKNSGYTIRNNGLFNIHAGYRFASQIAKDDEKKVKNLIPD